MPGTADPVDGPDEVVAFAEEFGLPVAIKAAYGGGGRGLKVARTLEEIPELFESAVREAVTAFGRGECFVERFLDHPRHVETQCLADQHGNVVVVSTRDCSLQRRNQKLVEEAPAPFITDEQHTELLRASKEILRAAGYVGAGTCEFLVGPQGDISFLEVNTRLQVEHPVSEEVTGIDLVREQFRIADGESLDYPDPEPHAHSIEFRINGEDAGRGFLPAPGTVTTMRVPQGPGVRWDSGLARGRHRRRRLRLDDRQAHRHRPHPAAGPRARRAAPWTSSSSRACPRSRRSTARSSPTRRSRRPTPTRSSRSTPAGSRPSSTTTSSRMPVGRPTPPRPTSARRSSSRSAASGSRCRCPAGSRSVAARARGAARKKAPRRSGGAKAGAAASGDSLTAPMQGTIVKIAVEEGATVAVGDLVVVLEAMKMEQPITAHKAGTVTGLAAEVGATVSNGAVLCEITGGSSRRGLSERGRRLRPRNSRDVGAEVAAVGLRSPVTLSRLRKPRSSSSVGSVGRAGRVDEDAEPHRAGVDEGQLAVVVVPVRAGQLDLDGEGPVTVVDHLVVPVEPAYSLR